MAGRELRVVELTGETFPLLEDLFGPRGAVGGCWCMWFRQSNAEQNANAGEPNRGALHRLPERGEPVGLLAVDGGDGRAYGWIAVSPRPAQTRLANSKVSAPPYPDEDLTNVWCVTCLFIRPGSRRRGIGRLLMRAAVNHAVRHGARIVEGYPVDTQPGRRYGAGELYHGTVSLFTAAGFEVVEHRGMRRALMRYRVR
jgi:GNAT superfamily N-acetyltransferase